MNTETHSAAETYRRATIENAPPAKLIRLLYEGAIRFLMQAEDCLDEDPQEQFASLVGRADDIIVELRLCLDPAHAPQIAENLRSLYLYCESQLATGLVEREKSFLVRAREVLTTLLSAWREVEGQVGAA